jgi:hypothetical protein
MTDTLSRRTGANESSLEIGDAVCITRGALSGLRGMLQAFTAHELCVLAIEGLAEGVQIVIGPDAVVRTTFDSDGAPLTS